MSGPRENFDEFVNELRKSRDELRVQMHLAAVEAREEWEVLEKKWEHFKVRAEQFGEAAGDAAEDLGEALELVGEELREGYKKIRKSL